MADSLFKTAYPQFEKALKQHMASNQCMLDEDAILYQSMHYSLFNGGKRLRANLAYAACHSFTANYSLADTVACVVEIIHSYSLIHDDLPSMDDDDFRRGEKSCHKVFGEGQTILAGDALQAYAIYVLAKIDNFSSDIIVEMIQVIAKASYCMAIGQSLDIAIRSKQELIQQIEKIYYYKTAALINASVQLGALASGIKITAAQKNSLDAYSRAIGIAFQIQDDIVELDNITDKININSNINSNPVKIQQHAEQDINKENYPTYVNLFGVNKARSRVEELYKQAICALCDGKLLTTHLDTVAKLIITRKE